MSNLPTPKPLVNQKDAASLYFRCDPKTLRNWLRDGKCPVAPIKGMKPAKWLRSDLVAVFGEPQDQ